MVWEAILTACVDTIKPNSCINLSLQPLSRTPHPIPHSSIAIGPYFTTDGPGVGFSLNGILIWNRYYSGIMYAVYHSQHILHCCGITAG